MYNKEEFEILPSGLGIKKITEGNGMTPSKKKYSERTLYGLP